MIVRITLSAIVTVALLGAITPAVEDAKHAREAATTERAVDRILSAATSLTESGAPPPTGRRGARMTLEVSLPAGTTIVLRNDSRILEARASAHPDRKHSLPVRVWTTNGAVRLRGDSTLTLAYERRAGAPVLVVAQGFTTDTEANHGHADTRQLAPRTGHPASRVRYHASRVRHLAPRTHRPASRAPR